MRFTVTHSISVFTCKLLLSFLLHLLEFCIISRQKEDVKTQIETIMDFLWQRVNILNASFRISAFVLTNTIHIITNLLYNTPSSPKKKTAKHQNFFRNLPLLQFCPSLLLGTRRTLYLIDSTYFFFFLLLDQGSSSSPSTSPSSSSSSSLFKKVGVKLNLLLSINSKDLNWNYSFWIPCIS